MDTAVILAAGMGTRMLPLSTQVPKCLIPINGRPFLAYVIHELRAAGIRRLVVVAGYLREKLASFLEASGTDAEIVVQDEQLGTGHALLTAQPEIKGQSFLVLCADNLWQAEDIRSMRVDDEYCYVAAAEHEHPERFGVLLAEGERVLRILEKPARPPTRLVNTGLYKLTPAIFSALGRLKPSPRGELELTDGLNALAAQGMLRAVRVKGFWLDLSRPEDISKVEAKVASCAAFSDM